MILTPEQEQAVYEIINNFDPTLYNENGELINKKKDTNEKTNKLPKETQQKIIEKCKQKNIEFTIELIRHFDIRQLRFIFYVCNKMLMEDDKLNDYDYDDNEKITNYIKNLLQHLNNDQINFVYNACEALIEEYQEV